MLALYYTEPIRIPPPVDTVVKRNVFDKAAFQELKKKTEERIALFSSISTPDIPRANPNQGMLDRRIRALKPLLSVSSKPFILHASLYGSNPVIEAETGEYIKRLNIASPDWLYLEPSGCGVHESVDWNAFEILNKDHVVVIPRFSNIGPL